MLKQIILISLISLLMLPSVFSSILKLNTEGGTCTAFIDEREVARLNLGGNKTISYNLEEMQEQYKNIWQFILIGAGVIWVFKYFNKKDKPLTEEEAMG